jgi:hypothetical protein
MEHSSLSQVLFFYKTCFKHLTIKSQIFTDSLFELGKGVTEFSVDKVLVAIRDLGNFNLEAYSILFLCKILLCSQSSCANVSFLDNDFGK